MHPKTQEGKSVCWPVQRECKYRIIVDRVPRRAPWRVGLGGVRQHVIALSPQRRPKFTQFSTMECERIVGKHSNCFSGLFDRVKKSYFGTTKQRGQVDRGGVPWHAPRGGHFAKGGQRGCEDLPGRGVPCHAERGVNRLPKNA